MAKREMLTCNPCVGLKGLIKEITNRIKGKCLKVARVQPRRKLECSKETATAEAKVGEEGNESTAEVKVGEEGNEWVAEPEPGVLMTLVPLPTGGNRIKKLRFSKELFDAWGAELWWRENYDKIVELYSVIQSQLPQTLSSHSNDESYPIDSTQAHELEESARSPRNSAVSLHSQRMDPCSNGQSEDSSTMSGTNKMDYY